MTTQGRELTAGEYWFDDVDVGDWFDTGRIVVTEAHIVGFAGLSGDLFDVHMDDEFAREQGFPSRIAHGLLGLAMADGLKNRSSARLMGVASLGWNWSFRAPILAGDRIGVRVRVAGKRVSSKGMRIATLAFSVTKQTGQEVQAGETALIMRAKPQPAA
jgi:3-hydroxybutyryl-CoA dehydratase